MIADIFRYSAFAISLGLSAIAVAQLPIEHQNAHLTSVHWRETDVFAMNKFGIFRADLESRQWKKLEISKSMPLGGKFANVPKESTLLLYVVADRSGAPGDMKYGIYASRDDGRTWEFLSANPDYGEVLLLPNGDLFAVTNPSNLGGPSRIHVSQDMGKTWRDITGKSFGKIFGIFPDPDHPAQICLRVNSIRNYILQADDQQYLWKTTREWDWHPERFQDSERFFNRGYSTQTTLYMLPATLNNYFEYDFGKGTATPSFDLSQGAPRISVPLGKAVRVPVTIRFLEDVAHQKSVLKDRRSKGLDAPEFAPTIVTLLDDESTTGLWGIRVEFEGQRTAKGSKVEKEVYKSNDRDAAREKILRETDWKEIQLSASQPYSRQIDLDQLYDFDAPGTYKVQLTYTNSIGDRDKGHWIGSFSGAPFEVVVTGE